jgi:hypothetical protein
MGRGLSAWADLAMPDGEHPEVQHRLHTLSPPLEELSAVPTGASHTGELVVSCQQKRRLKTNLRDRLLSSLAKSIRG